MSLIEQNRLLSQEVKRRIDQLAAINTVASVVGHTLDLDRTLATALDVVIDVVGAEASGISLIDEKTGELVLRAQKGWIHDFVTNPMRIPLDKGMSAQVIDTDGVVVYNNLDGTEEYAVPSFSREHFRAIAMAPMHARGRIIGILSIMSYQPDSFDESIVNVLRVIADTVGVALENARLYEASVEHERRLAAILHSTADGIIATDRNGNISLINHTAEAMLDIRKDNLLGVPLREAPIQPRLRDSLLQALSSRGEKDNKAFQVKLEEERVISMLVSPVYVESQIEQYVQMDGWVIVLQDVTHLHEAQIARAQFIQAAAHDMRNPLSITQSSLKMLDNHLEDQDESVEELIGLATGGIKRLQVLIDDLLHLEHIESGYNANLDEVNLGDILHEVVSEARPLAQQHDLTLALDVPDELPTIQVNIGWLKRALHNYVENACKYTPANGDILLRAYTDSNHIYIEVADNGPGIPAQAQARLFERFYRVDNHQGKRGSGLGLAIVKSVAEAHGGSVYVNSAPGEGSTFGLKLPVSYG